LTSGADIVVVYDVDGIVTDCNAAAASLLGYTTAELAGRPLAQIIPLQLRAEHRAQVRRLLGSAQVASVNTLRLARDGSEVPVHLTICPIKNATGSVMALCEVGGALSQLGEIGVPTSGQWREIFDSITSFVGVMSRDGVLLEVNQAALDAAGLRIADVIRRQVWDTYWWSYSKHAQQQIHAVMESVLKGNPVRQEFVVRMKGEQLVAVDCDFRPLRNEAGHVIAVVGSGVDVSARKSVEGALGQSTRNLLMLSDCNHELIRASDETALLFSICQVIVDVGGYPLACVGYAEHDMRSSVRIVAAAGLDTAQLQRQPISWDAASPGGGPTGQAIRDGIPSVCSNLDQDPAIAPWRDQALARGYVAAIAVPLILESGTLGALTIYSDREAAFDADQVKLLVELADNLAYGISALRARAYSERAEGKLQLL
jgi:PAS domain S-box-containing protein